MPSPITPNNLKDKLPSMDSPSVCDRLKKVLVDFPKYVYEFVAYIWDEDGNLTESFKNDVCAIECESITVEVDPPPGSGPGGNLKRPILKTIAGLRHDGGIPIVWNGVAGATHYDIYKYKPTNSKPTLTDAEVKTLATRLRRDLDPSEGGIQRGQDREGTTSDGYLYERKADNTMLYVDIDGGPAYDGKGGVDWNGSVVDGQSLYHYWVVPRNLNNSITVTGPLSNYVKAFSKYVTDFSTSGSEAKLLWSGNEETVPTGKTQMRVILRGGGGAGAAGGDWVTQAYNAPYIKNITDNGTKIVFETYTDHGFNRGDVIKLTESNSSAGWDGNYTVSYFENSRTFWVQGDDYVSHSSSPVRSTFTPTGESLAAFGKMHRELDEVALDIPGGAGGGGALLVASFDVLNASVDATNGISKVRCRTIDNSNAVVDYSARGQTTDTMSAYHEDPVVPWNRGGEGRESSTIGPKCGEPHATDSNASNNGSGSGYVTVLEVYNADNSGQWLEVARVSNGKGGGYSDVTGEFTGRGGDGGGKLGAAATTNRSNGGTGICTLNTNAKLGTGSGIGKLEYAGQAGGDSSAGIKGTIRGGHPASGGYIWDSARPSHNTSGRSDKNKFTRPSNGFDLGAPGSGGSGSMGATDKTSAPMAAGGHAFAGCAWVTYSSTTHNDY
jgi:hypothetical protein